MRNEYPRPDFVREQWQSLNGTWDFYEGLRAEKLQIQVPFVPQSRLSGIGRNLTSDTILYERQFTVPKDWEGKRILLHFGAVDYRCSVWVNGQCAGTHQGGQTPFTFDITDFLNGAEEHLRVSAVDYLTDESIPRGKQYWKEKGQFIWYTQSSGIWQPVWIEPVDSVHMEWMHFTPDIDQGTVEINYQVSDDTPDTCQMELDIRFRGSKVYTGIIEGINKRGKIIVDVFRNKALCGAFHFTGWYWSPEHPYLFDVKARLRDGDDCRDSVETYFGMRKIHVQDGRVYLNNQPYYQKLLLDQGYWKDGLMTAPDQEEYAEDIRKAKAMGFNGCRKHEKVEDPVFLYWADRLGFLVWESMASFWSFTPQGATAFAEEWTRVIQRDYNHPCIVLWNMMNESWGVPRVYDDSRQQHFARAMYHMARGLDDTRLVIANDGWEMTENDICAFHTYKHGEQDDTGQQARFRAGVKSLEGLSGLVERSLFAKGFSYEGQPVMLTEIGGVAIRTAEEEHGEEADSTAGVSGETENTAGADANTFGTAEADPCRNGDGNTSWGYTGADGPEAFLEVYERLIGDIYASDLICGFCYTQLADIEQEQNGLLDEMHQYKADAAEIKRINDGKATTGSFSTVE